MEEGNLAKLIEDEAGKKGPLWLNGGEQISPMYEALTAMFKANLNDAEIIDKLDDNAGTLREILVTDAILDELNEEQRMRLKRMLADGRSLSEIVGRAAVYVAAERGYRDQKVLEHPPNVDVNMLMALGNAGRNNIYIEAEALRRAEGLVGQVNRSRLRETVIAGILFISVGFGALYGLVKLSEMNQWDLDPWDLSPQEAPVRRELPDVPFNYGLADDDKVRNGLGLYGGH